MHNKASNIGCWGDSGRYPLFYEVAKLSIDYFEHVQSCHEFNDGSLLAAAFHVQRDLGLDWYSNITNLMTSFKPKNPPTYHKKLRPSIAVAEAMRSQFVSHWTTAKSQSPKLEFYHEAKKFFELEPYLNAVQNYSHRASVTRFRISAHNLYVERGRYVKPLKIPREARVCSYCLMTLGQKIIEDEKHVLYYCPLYKIFRADTLTTDQGTVMNIPDLFASPDEPNETHSKLTTLGAYIHKILETNLYFTNYYCSQDCHTNTGVCAIL